MTVDVEDSLNDRVGVFHLADRFVEDLVGQAKQSPILEHAGVQDVLVGRRQFVLEDEVKVLDDLGLRLASSISIVIRGHHSRGIIRGHHSRASGSGGAPAPIIIQASV